MKGRHDESLSSLEFLYPPLVAEQHHRELVQSSRISVDDDAPRRQEQSSSWRLLSKPKYRSALIAGWGLIFLNQATGQPTAMAYSASLLRGTLLHHSGPVWIAIFKIITTAIGMLNVERFGRKPLLLVGTSLMALMLMVVWYLTWTRVDDDESPFTAWQNILLLVATFVYFGGFQIGIGTTVWLVCFEVFELEIRGPAMAVAVQLNFGMHALTQSLIPTLYETIGLTNIFAIFCAVCFWALWFIHTWVPETKSILKSPTAGEEDLKYLAMSVSF